MEAAQRLGMTRATHTKSQGRRCLRLSDNDVRCLELDTRDYAEIPIGRILLGEDELEQYGMDDSFRPVRFVTLKACRARRSL